MSHLPRHVSMYLLFNTAVSLSAVSKRGFEPTNLPVPWEKNQFFNRHDIIEKSADMLLTTHM